MMDVTGNWRSTTGSSMFFSGLQMGTPYTVYVYALNSSGDKSDTVSISVETGCSFPGGNCLVVGSEETVKNNGTPPVSPYAAIQIAEYVTLAWIVTSCHSMIKKEIRLRRQIVTGASVVEE